VKIHIHHTRGGLRCDFCGGPIDPGQAVMRLGGRGAHPQCLLEHLQQRRRQLASHHNGAIARVKTWLRRNSA